MAIIVMQFLIESQNQLNCRGELVVVLSIESLLMLIVELEQEVKYFYLWVKQLEYIEKLSENRNDFILYIISAGSKFSISCRVDKSYIIERA